MNRERKNIPFTQDEKENSIAFILKEVNLQPVTFREFIRSYFQEVGFRYLFLGNRRYFIYCWPFVDRSRDTVFSRFKSFT